jgi:hypothetical protein
MGADKGVGKLGIFSPSGVLYRIKTDERKDIYQILNKRLKVFFNK